MTQEVEMEPTSHCQRCHRCGYANARTWALCAGCYRRLPHPTPSNRPGDGRASRSRPRGAAPVAAVRRRLDQATQERRVLGDISTAGWLVPGVNAALVGTALWGTSDAAQRSQLLLAASVAASVALAGAGLAAQQLARVPVEAEVVRIAPAAPVPVACERRRVDHLSDAELRAAIAW